MLAGGAAATLRAMSATIDAHDHLITVGEGDAGLDTRLSAELDAHNFAAVCESNLVELTVKVEDASGELVGGWSGWTWGTCAAFGFVWDRRGQPGVRGRATGCWRKPSARPATGAAARCW